MIKFIEHKDINKKKWDNCIDQSYNQSVSAYSWYLDLVCKNWSAIILNDYEAVFPLPINSKFTFKYCLQPFFIRCLGIYSKDKLTEEIVNSFFDCIPKSVKLIDIYLKENISFSRVDFDKNIRRYQTLNLKQSYEQLFEGFKGDAKRNVKKASKFGLRIVESLSAKEVVSSFKANKGYELKGLQAKNYITLGNLMNVAKTNDFGFAIGVLNNENQLIASGFFITWNDEILFLISSVNEEGKHKGAMYFMLNYVFITYAGKFNIFDFGGSSVESVANFNHNFGAKDCLYLRIKRNNLPPLVKWIKSLNF